jgi:ABC-type amino acid transport substrate-binding protein
LRSAIAAVWLLLVAVGSAHAQAAQAPMTQDRVLVIGTKEAPPFAMKSDDGTWTGISIELWARIAQDLNLHYRFKETTLEGLIDQTADGSLDAAVAALTVSAAREQVVDFTQSFFTTGLGIAVPQSTKFDWMRLLGSFLSRSFLEALLGVVGMTIAVGVIIWLLERPHSEHFGGVRKGLATGVWWSAQILTRASADHKPGTLLGRLIAVGWMGASVIAIAVFTAGITSQLTAKQLQGVVHGVADLKYARVGAVGGTSSLDYLTKHGIRFRTYGTPKEGLESLQAGKIDALVYDRPLLAWYVQRGGGAGPLNVLDLTFDEQNYAIALPNGSPLRQRINRELLSLIHSPWWDELNAKYFGKE